MANDDAFLSALLGNNGANTTGSADINAFERTLASNDILRQLSGPIMGAKFNTSTWTPGQTLGVSLGQSFLGGLLNGFAQRNEGQQLEKMAQVLPQLYRDPGSVSNPGVDAEAFGGFKLRAMEEQARTAEAVKRSLGEKYITTNLDGSVRPTPGATDAIAELLGSRQRPEQNALKGIPASLISELAKSKSVVDEGNTTASLLETSGATWADVIKAKAFSGLDEQGLALTLKNLADKLARARTGAAMSKEEVKLYSSLVGGDLSASPPQSAALIRKLTAAEARMATSELDFLAAGAMGIEGLKSQFSAPTQGLGLDENILKSEAEDLRSRGLTPAQIAATLRAKYSRK